MGGWLWVGAASALCPWNTSFDSGLGFCTDTNNAFGPFTRGMTNQCTSAGGGPACSNTVSVFYNGTSTTGIAVPVQRWAKDFARSVRGTASCPRGASANTSFDNRCVEVTGSFGTEVYGPFPQTWIDRCRSAQIGGGNACFLNRWSSTVYNSVKNSLGPSWRLPMPNGFTTSDWCVCRNIGTNPHIGWDLVNNGSMTSVAIEAGTVSRGPTLNGSCGWELEITDRYSTKWFYRHLNRPNLVNGQSLAAGATVGLHRDYPGSGCGSGAHLHFERLNAGYFGDSSVSKNCTGTVRSCNWDPRKPFPSFIRTPVVSTLVFSDLNESVETVPEGQAQGQAQILARACRLDPSRYAAASDDDLRDLLAPPRELEVDLALAPVAANLDFDAKHLAASARFAGNPSNQCEAARGQNCLISWSLFAQNDQGEWLRVWSDASIRNSPVSMDAEAAFCAPALRSGEFKMVLKDLRGQRYGVDLLRE